MSPKLFLVLFLGGVLLTATSSLARSSAQTTTEDEPETTLMMGGGGKKGPSKSGPKQPSNYKPPTFSVHDQEFEAMADDGTYEDQEKPETPRATGETGRDGEEAIREAGETIREADEYAFRYAIKGAKEAELPRDAEEAF